jgi:transcriptional regulator with PAS, ATPase and Fis domain
MENIQIHIKIFSDIKDTSSVLGVLHQLQIKGFGITYGFPKSMEIKQDEIIIIQLRNISSKLLRAYLQKRGDNKNKVFFVTKENDALMVSSLVKLGFEEIFVLPYENIKLMDSLEMTISSKSFLSGSKRYLKPGEDFFSSIIGESENFKKVIGLAKKISFNSSASVLITGETGTGKGILAKAIHDTSTLKITSHDKLNNYPFVDIVCSAIPEALLESELFGHEKGAFTDARIKKIGLFELAENGTVFLDEVGDLSLNLQTKLLRVIEKKVIRRLGAVKDIPINARIISATHKDLEDMIKNGLFREDLYHRLNVLSIIIPPLRERGDDVLLLAELFIKEFNILFEKKVTRIDGELEEFILTYSWPGNVRELKNAVERAVLLSDVKTLHLKDFSNLLKDIPLNSASVGDTAKHSQQLLRFETDFSKTRLKEFEKVFAKEVFKKMGRNKSKTAKVLGISRPKLDALLS